MTYPSEVDITPPDRFGSRSSTSSEAILTVFWLPTCQMPSTEDVGLVEQDLRTLKKTLERQVRRTSRSSRSNRP